MGWLKDKKLGPDPSFSFGFQFFLAKVAIKTLDTHVASLSSPF
jgi:hypothetical protein